MLTTSETYRVPNCMDYVLKRSGLMGQCFEFRIIFNVSLKASLRFPDLATIDANRRFAVQLSCAAVDRLCCACDASYSPEVLPPLKGLAVARVMEDILVRSFC